MSTSENKAIVRRLIVETIEKGDFALIDKLVKPDVLDHAPLPGVPSGREGYRQTLQIYREVFHPTAAIQEQIAEGDLVVTRWNYSGKQTAPFLGVPASGKAVAGEVIMISRFEQGLLAEEWMQFDSLSLMTQIGAFPEMAAAAT